MKLDLFIKQHPALNYAEDLKMICQPLSELGIVYFSHVHIDELSRMSCLGIRPEFFKLYFDKGYYNYDLHKASINVSEQYILWDTIERKKQSKNLHEDFMSFNQGHTFSIIFNHGNTKDCYHFGAKLGDSAMNENYLKNIDSLKMFIMYFKDKVASHKALLSAYDLKLELSKDKGGYLTKEPQQLINLERFNDLINLDRIYINGGNTYITQRELECLHWMAMGKTAEEIGLLLTITTRTVKAHIANIKNKLGCYNQFQLGMVYEKIKSSIGSSTP